MYRTSSWISQIPSRLTIPGRPRVFFRREKGTDCPHRTENGVKNGTVFIRKGISRGCGVKSTGVFTRPPSADNELAKTGQPWLAVCAGGLVHPRTSIAGGARWRQVPQSGTQDTVGGPEWSEAERSPAGADCQPRP